MKTRLVATLLALACAATASAQTLDAAKLDRLFDRLLEKNKVMGGLTVARDGKVVYGRSFGYRQIDDRQRPHAYLLRALHAAIAQPGAVTYPEDLLTPQPAQVASAQSSNDESRSLDGRGEALLNWPGVVLGGPQDVTDCPASLWIRESHTWDLRKSAILLVRGLWRAGTRSAVPLRFSVIFEYGGLIP